MQTETGRTAPPRPAQRSRALRAACFLALLLSAFLAVQELLRDKSDDKYLLWDRRLEQQTEWDVVFAGSSKMNCSVYPMELWAEYGFTSFNNAQSGEVLPISYYTCRDILRRCHPKVLVLDVGQVYLDREYGNLVWAHKSLEPLSFRNWLEGVLDVVPAERRMEFLLPITLYHPRWSELRQEDFIRPDPLLRGASEVFKKAEDISPDMTWELTPAQQKVRPGDIPVAAVDKIVQLCRDTGTQLLLVAIPYFTSPDVENPTHNMKNDQANYNWFADYAAQNGVDYINYFHLLDEVGWDWFEFMYNHSHINYWGGERITRHLGRYLQQTYALPDRRDDPASQNWNEDLQRYEEWVENNLAGAGPSQG